MMDEHLEIIRENAEHAGDLHTLVERLKGAAEPDRLLNAAIWLTVVAPHVRNDRPYGVPTDAYYARICPRYTESIDAAMTLVPAQCYARIQTATRDYISLAWVTDEVREFSWQGEASNPAIALCIAALEASAAISSQKRGT